MTIRIPAEWEPHAFCCMAWAVDARDEWRDIEKAKSELANVVETIARREPVKLFAAEGESATEARSRFSEVDVEIIEAPVDDIWMRDILPTFALRNETQVVAIDWNFNSWGNTSDRPARDGDRVGKFVAAHLGVELIDSSMVGEGGAMIVNGFGALITTRSCLLNENRNRGPEREFNVRSALEKFGTRVVWLEGDTDEPITSGHIDGYALFAPSGCILVETQDSRRKSAARRNADIRLLESLFDVVGVVAPRAKFSVGHGRFFAPGYLNAYVANGALILGAFDPERDEIARKTLSAAFPAYEVIMLDIRSIAENGGGVHCLTQPFPVISGSRQ